MPFMEAFVRRQQWHLEWGTVPNMVFGTPQANAPTIRADVIIISYNVCLGRLPRLVNSELKRRLENEEDDDVRETLQHVLSLLGVDAPVTKKPKVDKGKARETPAIRFNLSKSKPSVHFETKPTTIPATSPSPATPANAGADLHRTPAMTPAQAQDAKDRLETAHARTISLGTIQRIEDSLAALERAFVFPAELDLARPATPAGSASGWDSDSETELAFTPKNKPVHAYEHALNGLLAKLDAVESFGDEEVRGRRKEVVNKVERAIREVGRRVEESRERARASSEVAVEEPTVKIPIRDASEDKVEADTATEAVDAPVDSAPAPVESTPAPFPILASTEPAFFPASAYQGSLTAPNPIPARANAAASSSTPALNPKHLSDPFSNSSLLKAHRVPMTAKTPSPKLGPATISHPLAPVARSDARLAVTQL